MTDTEAKEDVDLEALWGQSVPCAVNDCQADIKWKVTFLCCGWYAFTCGPHKDRAQRVWFSLDQQGHGLRCGDCGATVPLGDIKWDKA